MIEIITFEQWMSKKCGFASLPTQKAIDEYQQRKMREMAHYAAEHSRFYRDLYAGYDLDKPFDLPFTTSDDIIDSGNSMVCLSQTKIKRIISMSTSGSTGQPKRVYFSEDDLELTIDFFAHGMLYLTSPGERVMIFMDGDTPDGLGDLLSRGLRRIGTEPFAYGYVRDLEDAARAASSFNPHCIVGVPQQMQTLTEAVPSLRPKTVLLSADNVLQALRERIGELWQADVFAHWGMRETGLGGAVECPRHDGQHIRHADLLIEIIDPHSGERLPDGEKGEIVFSTLTREAMPLLRYRTGDISYLISKPCACGSNLKRLGEVVGHKI